MMSPTTSEDLRTVAARLEAAITHQIRTLPRGKRTRDRIRLLETAFRQACNASELIALSSEIGGADEAL